MSQHASEVESGERFEFGKNWSNFLSILNDDRIGQAESSLIVKLGVKGLAGKSFIDIGSGSGLFSLAARKLGATVHSFDYDTQSVACTNELRTRYFPTDSNWKVESGSVLDREYLKSLGKYDVVYSWGVLHHTGAMWDALDNVTMAVAEGGRLFIAIYNDQGGWSRRWLLIKKIYNKLPAFLKPLFGFLVMAPREFRTFAISCLKGTPWQYFKMVSDHSRQTTRGMSYWYDLIDWVGGYPFEVATPEQIFEFYRARGFELRHLKTCGSGLGCNEFVFEKVRSL